MQYGQIFRIGGRSVFKYCNSTLLHSYRVLNDFSEQQVRTAITSLINDGNLLNNAYRNDLFLNDVKSSIQKLLERPNLAGRENKHYGFFNLKEKLYGEHSRALDYFDLCRDKRFR